MAPRSYGACATSLVSAPLEGAPERILAVDLALREQERNSGCLQIDLLNKNLLLSKFN